MNKNLNLYKLIQDDECMEFVLAESRYYAKKYYAEYWHEEVKYLEGVITIKHLKEFDSVDFTNKTVGIVEPLDPLWTAIFYEKGWRLKRFDDWDSAIVNVYTLEEALNIKDDPERLYFWDN